MEQEIDGSGGVENGRRRRWTLEEKRAVVELSLDPACSMAEVAACFDVLPAQIYVVSPAERGHFSKRYKKNGAQSGEERT